MLMNWHIVTSAEYTAGVKKDIDLYFLKDTHEIYRGEVPFTESVVFYTDDLPTSGIAKNRLYINSTTLEGKTYDGTEWKTVINPVADTVTENGTTAVSGKAVAAYVSAKLAGIAASKDVVSKLSWDSAEHILTATKGDNSTQTVLFDGLGVTLTYTASTGALQLADASGNAIGDVINLDLERFVHSGVYDPESKNITLYFDANRTEEDAVKIPVGDLVDTYVADEDSTTASIKVTNNKIQASVKISRADGNQIEIKDDGLYVSKLDISGKMDKDTDAIESNIAVFDANGNAVDSGKSFTDIVSNNHVYTGATLEEAITGKTPTANDVAIVIEKIGDDSSDKAQRTGYIYNGETWVPLDDKYNWENVYIPTDIMTTSQIGNITLTNGQATIASKGKNLKQLWDSIFIKEKNPAITQPSVSVTLKANNTTTMSYEVGTSVTPSYTATLNPGTYEFNPGKATGVTASSWEISDTASHTATTNAGSFDTFTVEDGTSYKITAKANYADGGIPLTNTGNEYTSGQIKAGSKSATTAAITGFRKAFYGTKTTKTDAIDSAFVRSLTGTGSAVKKGSTMTINVPAGATRIVFAYDATLPDPTSVIDSGTKYNVKTSYTMTQVDVEGANGYTAKAYKVFCMDSANPLSACTHTVTI